MNIVPPPLLRAVCCWQTSLTCSSCNSQQVQVALCRHTVTPVEEVPPVVPRCVDLCLVFAAADTSSIPHMPAGTHAVLVTGMFKASKGRDAQELANNILLLLAVIRLPQHGTDLLVSVNAPVCVSAGSSAGVQPGVQPAAQGQAGGVMQGVLSSLCVQDWGLFGGS